MQRIVSSSARSLWSHGTRALSALMVAAVLLLAYTLLGAAGSGPGYAVVLAQDAGTASVTAAGVVISYQGRLIDPTTGLPKADGAYPMSFRLYNVESGGSPLYTESRTVPVVRSTFSVLVGDVTPLNLSIFTGQPLYLGITVSSDPEMAPRLRLAHAPYAIYAETAESALNAQNASNAAVAAAVADNAITTAKIADGSVTGADVADGSISVADLNAGARSPRFIDINIFGAQRDGSTSLSAGFGAFAGLILEEVSGTYGAFAVQFTLPPDFPAGGTLTGRIVYNIGATGCQVSMQPNAISVARVGRNHIVGPGGTTGLIMPTTTFNVPATANESAAIPFTVTSPRSDTPLLALDTITINFYRSNFSGTPDTCVSNMNIQGISLTY